MTTPSLAWFVSQKFESSCPDQDQQFLIKVLAANTERNRRIAVQACQIVQMLNSAGVIPVVLKGTAGLLQRTYPHPGYRMQTDIDLLVMPEEIEIASGAFAEMDYLPVSTTMIDGINQIRFVTCDEMPVLERQYKNKHHLPPLYRENEVASVELHRHAYHRQYQHARELAGLCHRAIESRSEGVTFKVLAARDQLDLLVVGSYVNDGHRHRYRMPLRTANDYLMLWDTLCDGPGFIGQDDFEQSSFHELVHLLLRPLAGIDATVRHKVNLRMMQLTMNHVWFNYFVEQYAHWRRRIIHYGRDPLDIINRIERAKGLS